MLRASPPRPHLPPHLGSSAGPGALRGRDRGEGRAAAGPAPRRPQTPLLPPAPAAAAAAAAALPASPLRPSHLEAGPERDRRCRTVPFTVRTRRSRPRSRSGRGRSAAEVRGARLPPRAGPRRPAPPPCAPIGREPRLTARRRSDWLLGRQSRGSALRCSAGEARRLLGYGGGSAAGSETGTSVCVSVCLSVPRGRLRARPCLCPAVPRRSLPPLPPSRPHHCRCKSATPRPAREHRLRSDRAPAAESRRGRQPQQRAAPAGLQHQSPGPAVPPALPVSAPAATIVHPAGGARTPPPAQRALVRSGRSTAPVLSPLPLFRPAPRASRHGQDQGPRPAREEEGGAAEAAGGSEGGAVAAARGQSDRRGRLQAVQDPCGAQIHCQSADCHQPDTEGELEEVLQGQEVQAPGSAAQEDSGHAAQAQQARGEPEDQEAAAKGTSVPSQEICHQGIALSTCGSGPGAGDGSLNGVWFGSVTGGFFGSG